MIDIGSTDAARILNITEKNGISICLGAKSNLRSNDRPLVDIILGALYDKHIYHGAFISDTMYNEFLAKCNDLLSPDEVDSKFLFLFSFSFSFSLLFLFFHQLFHDPCV